MNKISSLFGFGFSSLPEKYLGIPLVQGKVSKATVAPLIDKIWSRASGWSGKILSFQSRIDLVKSILTSLPIYNMAIYKWSIVAIQEGERIIQNFLWSGDLDRQKFVTIKWNKVLKHPNEGGIGIHGFRDINLSMLMKLGWGFLNAQDPWATFLRAKCFTRGGLLINYKKHSSIWNGLKEVIAAVEANSKWIIGLGRDIDFWRDCWGSEVALIDLLNIQPEIWKHCISKLSQIIFRNDWSAPQAIVDFLNTQGIDLNSLSLNNTDQDIRVWKHHPQGIFSVYSAFDVISSHRPKVWWHCYTKGKFIQPRIASFICKVCHNSLPTEDDLIKRGLILISICSFCLCNLETLNHLIWQCSYSKQLWDWLASFFHIQAVFANLKQTFDACSQKSSYISDLLKAAVLNFIYFLWQARNDIVFEGTPFCSIKLKCKILAAVIEAADLSANNMSNNYFHLAIIIALGVPINVRPLPRVQSCTWALPWFQEVKINVGAVAMGSLGTAGTGAVARNHCGEVIGVLSHGVGIKNLLYSECEAMIGALFWATQRSWKYIWIEADFQSTITSFARNQAPWPHRARWNR
ncbi:hypothetical protein GIB67_040319 [Kingdonia uniflora]|uniref:Reverse transcriptase zinc-binding domain-containing protein n=1 Tax=Kingdonia uniflora TaxID=39325 RepID=A0A7J7LUN0_9MAGN|nr:hypothetical protein GIB67_040319 [Kingdonia uniflora]